MRVAMTMMSVAKGQHSDKVDNQARKADRQELAESQYAYAFCQSLESLVDNLNTNKPGRYSA